MWLSCVVIYFNLYRKIKLVGIVLVWNQQAWFGYLIIEWIPALDYLSTDPPVGLLVSSHCHEGLLIALFLCVYSTQYDVSAPTPHRPPAGHQLPEVGRELPAGWATGGGDPAPSQAKGSLQADAQPVIRASRLSSPASSFLSCISSLHHLFLQPQPSARLPFVVLFVLLAQLCGWCCRPSFFTYASSVFPAYGPHTWFFLVRRLPALTQRQSWVSLFFSVPHVYRVECVFGTHFISLFYVDDFFPLYFFYHGLGADEAAVHKYRCLAKNIMSCIRREMLPALSFFSTNQFVCL